MQDESKPTNEPTPKPKRTLEEFYQETRAGRDLIAARRRLQDSMRQKQGGLPTPDEKPKDEPQSKPPSHEHPAAAFYRETRAERAGLSGTAPEMIFMPGLSPESYEREKRKSPPPPQD